jgi:hypothetical protein
MTTFQLICAGVFCGLLLVTYRKELLARLNLTGSAKPTTTDPAAPRVHDSIAVPLVDDILAVTKLRDRLAAEGCKEGVDACTALLRVIVEYEQPSKGVV